MILIHNDEKLDLKNHSLTVLDFLKIVELDPSGVAVMVNEKIVFTEEYGDHFLTHDDVIETMYYQGGGS